MGIILCFFFMSSVFAVETSSLEVELEENRLFPIVCEQDIPKDYQGTVAPISCVAVVVLSYYQRVPIEAVYTKMGIHPFATYVTDTYSLSSGATFVHGAQGSYASGDESMLDYLRRHDLIVERQRNVYTETELKNAIVPSLLNQNPVIVYEFSSHPYLIVGIRQSVEGDILFTLSPLQKGRQEMLLASFAHTSLDMIFVVPSQPETKSLMEEIAMLLKKRWEEILNEWKWDLELWFYKQINSFLSGFHTQFPWFSSSP